MSSRVRGAEEDGEPEVLRDPHRRVRQSPGLCPGPFDIRDMSPFAQGFVCVARAAYSPPSCVLACYWSIVVCYWSISQSQTTTQLGGEKAALHKVQQHKRTLVHLLQFA